MQCHHTETSDTSHVPATSTDSEGWGLESLQARNGNPCHCGTIKCEPGGDNVLPGEHAGWLIQHAHLLIGGRAYRRWKTARHVPGVESLPERETSGRSKSPVAGSVHGHSGAVTWLSSAASFRQ